MIGVIDYGLGNVQAFLNVYKRLNIAAFSVGRPEQLSTATKVILPGVGAFDHAMERLDQSGLRDALSDRVLREGVPVLGVCVGMQMLARSSEEGSRPGLGWIQGDVKRFTAPVPLPHMGWNDVKSAASNRLLAGLESDARFYFLHSYYVDCDRPADALALTEYGA